MALTFRSAHARSAGSAPRSTSTPAVHHVFFDVDHPEVAHTRIDCPENGGLIELVET